MLSAVEFVESLSPWPAEFGLERMRSLLAELGNPQLAFPAIHVVGTTGKGTTARTIEETLTREGFHVGGYYSPHVTGWSERIRIGGGEADFSHAVEGVRPQATALGATQFEVLTAAALTEFARASVDVAVVEAGLGGRLDATNVLRSPVQVLTNVALEHTAVLGDTRTAIAGEKLAVVQAGARVVLGEEEWSDLALANGAGHVIVEPGGNRALGGAAASAFVGREVDPVEVSLPGRLQFLEGEIRDGAHTPEAVRYIAPRLPPIGAIAASILSDKDAEGVLAELAHLAPVLVATQSANPRALPATELGYRARRHFSFVQVEPDPAAAVALAHELGSPVLVTGSLYLLADLAMREEESSSCRTLVSG